MILYHIIYTSLYLQTPRKSATTKEHIPSKNGLSQDAEIPKSLSLVLLDWVQLKNSANGCFLSRKSMTDPGNVQRGYQGSSRVGHQGVALESAKFRSPLCHYSLVLSCPISILKFLVNCSYNIYNSYIGISTLQLYINISIQSSSVSGRTINSAGNYGTKTSANSCTRVANCSAHLSLIEPFKIPLTHLMKY